MNPEIIIQPRIAALCPDMQVAVIRARVTNTPTPPELWQEILTEAERISSSYQILEINSRPAIAATRRLYRALGKDPGRYRVASEALCRRVIRGLGLYRLTTLIDLINLVSMGSGYPISGLDADRLVGDTLTMGVGEKDEIYHGIGRGLLNIQGMPVYRDAQGPVATPTSDEERTKITPQTTHIQICINAFAPEMPLTEALDWTLQLLDQYAAPSSIQSRIITP